MLECVVNISEGADEAVLESLRRASGDALLDVHSDRHHNRSVFTLAGPDVRHAARSLARGAVALLDVSRHSGVHPRIGVVDVVPFVPVPGTTSSIDEAVTERNAFAAWMANELGVPCFHYGPERTLPDVRKQAFAGLRPDEGPAAPHETAGACATGARPLLVAYNLWLTSTRMDEARRIARSLRSPTVRSLALDVGGVAQISCNLIAPETTGPGAVYDSVATLAPIERAELVGLIPRAVLRAEPPDRWELLDLAEERTIEARLATGLNAGKVWNGGSAG